MTLEGNVANLDRPLTGIDKHTEPALKAEDADESKKLKAATRPDIKAEPLVKLYCLRHLA
jgi:hypothetical protein